MASSYMLCLRVLRTIEITSSHCQRTDKKEEPLDYVNSIRTPLSVDFILCLNPDNDVPCAHNSFTISLVGRIVPITASLLMSFHICNDVVDEGKGSVVYFM
ncbi:hypothetical protein Bbelb_259130 [Branchiostoma belcheri]|nr:hypothetical protein Bbelb_259130 [Branchiostoma belcheri]